MSSPLEAATSGGMVRVLSGSSRPSVGLRRRLAMPVLACSAVRSKMLTPVVSLPVPAVVGMAISGLSGPGTGMRLADRRVDVVEEVGRGIGRVEVGGLGGVDDRPAADGDEAVELVAAREGDRVLERHVGRLDAHAVVDDGGDAGGLERLEHRGERRQAGDDRVGDHQGPAHAQVGEIHPDFTRDPGAEPHAGGGHLEGVFVLHGGSLPSRASPATVAPTAPPEQRGGHSYAAPAVRRQVGLDTECMQCAYCMQ